MEGILDSNRQGIFYLSESFSRLQFQPPSNIQETMISSKISGDDKGFSYNRAGAMNFDLYGNTIPFGADIISPIADYALSYYRYSLIGLTRDKDGIGTYRIKFIPKNKSQALWEGEIFIQDQKWNIQAFDAYILGTQIKQPIFDTLKLFQMYFPAFPPEGYKIQNQRFEFAAGIFGLKMKGNFLLVFSNYQPTLNPGMI